MRSIRSIVVLVFGLAVAGVGPDPVRADEPVRPRQRDIRHEESWSPAPDGTDFWDPVKHIELGDPDFWLSLGASLRLRGEAWSGYRFGGARSSNAIYGLGQVRVHTDWHLTRYVRAFIEGKSALVTERRLEDGRRPEDADVGDLQQAFFDLAVPFDAGEVWLRTGRQEMRLGSGRLLSAEPWTNTRRTFDALRLHAEVGDGWLGGLAAAPVEVQRLAFNLSHVDRERLWGVWTGGTLLDSPTTRLTLDGYWLWHQRDDASWGGVVGAESRHTVGLHLAARLPTGFVVDAEGAAQFGEHAGRDIAAGFFAATVERRFDVLAGLDVGFEVDVATGDDDPFDDRVGTFSRLFGERQPWLGLSNLVGRPNIMSPGLWVALQPLETLRLEVGGHVFYMSGTADFLYDAGGTPYRAGRSDASHFVGGELDIEARYRFDEHSDALLGWAHVFPGGFVEATGSSDGADFGTLQYRYQF